MRNSIQEWDTAQFLSTVPVKMLKELINTWECSFSNFSTSLSKQKMLKNKQQQQQYHRKVRKQDREPTVVCLLLYHDWAVQIILKWNKL